MIRGLLCLIAYLSCYAPIFCTTIIPYDHLGDLTNHTSHIVVATSIEEVPITRQGVTYFHYQLEVEKVVKGQIVSSTIFVQRYKSQQDNYERKIFGDIELQVGSKYLLFLDQLYDNVFRPRVMNYYVFEELQYRNEYVFVPNSETADLTIRDEVEPLQVYQRDKLLAHLELIASMQVEWNEQEVKSQYQSIDKIQPRSVLPGHCHNYYDEELTRWNTFDSGGMLPIYIDQDSDPLKSNSEALVENAIKALENGYKETNINLDYHGQRDFDPCQSNSWFDNSANGYYFQQWADSTIGKESIFVMFDDPCNELPAFKCGGKGTLAFGGLYRTLTETHSHEDTDWYMGYMGFVLVAKGAGCISDDKYQSMLMHEMGHALGLGHIEGSGTALMNPNCCNPVTELDQTCMNSMYRLDNLLPVEFVQITGASNNRINQIEFKTAEEINNDYFELQRWVFDDQFMTITSLLPQINSEQSIKTYQVTDQFPLNGSNYYRIAQYDLDGQVSYSEVISISTNLENKIRLYPNPATTAYTQLYIPNPDADGAVTIYSLQGQPIQQIRTGGYTHIPIDTYNYHPGTYLLSYTDSETSHTEKLIIR